MSTCTGVTKKNELCSKTARYGDRCHAHQRTGELALVPVLAQEPQTAAGAPRKADPYPGARARLAARQRHAGRPRRPVAEGFSRAPSLAHAPKAPRAVDMRVRQVLARYRARQP